MHQVECCQINRWNCSDEVYATLEGIADVEVHTFSCIGNCHQCPTKAHGLIDGKRIENDSPEKLLEQVLELIQS
ncbi:DUF1450 domain-containing protein [Desertibacillus haloalkaliphilus]|uniref:DUF1450 domain-containing protein n=1 Tax=Desertibacillus haloalkaliphilus TaxID=1328930 RepID=UPI001C2519FC|nr:DUF1450 domain-containing protein [Desertibacillus haloalkaliphilus]MBU8909008.1 YuzB family protein [Desertibacillus haloalkaliphilus]